MTTWATIFLFPICSTYTQIWPTFWQTWDDGLPLQSDDSTWCFKPCSTVLCSISQLKNSTTKLLYLLSISLLHQRPDTVRLRDERFHRTWRCRRWIRLRWQVALFLSQLHIGKQTAYRIQGS